VKKELGMIDLAKKGAEKVSGSGEGQGDQVESDNEEEDEKEYGEREVKKVKDLAKPSPDKIEAHERTHLPFRSWCEACVKGRGKEEACRKVDGGGGERNLPEVHFDFCFPKHEDEEGMTVFCGRERDTRMTLASTVPSKSTGEFAAKRVVAFLREIGCEQGDIIVKSDQEPAMLSLLTRVSEVRASRGGGRCIMENSPVGSSGSNGIIERAIQAVEEQARVMRCALEKKVGSRSSRCARYLDMAIRVRGHVTEQNGGEQRWAYIL